MCEGIKEKDINKIGNHQHIEKHLIILGTGQYSYVAEEIARSTGEYHTIERRDYEGDIEELKSYVTEFENKTVKNNIVELTVAIGNPEIRLQILQEIEEAELLIATLIHPQAVVASTSNIAVGSIVEAMVVVNPNVVIERGCYLSAGVVINHDTRVEEGCHIDCNGTVKSNSIVPKKTKVECGEVFRLRKSCPDNYSFEIGV